MLVYQILTEDEDGLFNVVPNRNQRGQIRGYDVINPDGEVAKSYRRKMDADDFATRSNNDIRVLRDVSTHKSKGKIKLIVPQGDGTTFRWIEEVDGKEVQKTGTAREVEAAAERAGLDSEKIKKAKADWGKIATRWASRLTAFGLAGLTAWEGWQIYVQQAGALEAILNSEINANMPASEKRRISNEFHKKLFISWADQVALPAAGQLVAGLAAPTVGRTIKKGVDFIKPVARGVPKWTPWTLLGWAAAEGLLLAAEAYLQKNEVKTVSSMLKELWGVLAEENGWDAMVGKKQIDDASIEDLKDAIEAEYDASQSSSNSSTTTSEPTSSATVTTPSGDDLKSFADKFR